MQGESSPTEHFTLKICRSTFPNYINSVCLSREEKSIFYRSGEIFYNFGTSGSIFTNPVPADSPCSSAPFIPYTHPRASPSPGTTPPRRSRTDRKSANIRPFSFFPKNRTTRSSFLETPHQIGTRAGCSYEVKITFSHPRIYAFPLISTLYVEERSKTSVDSCSALSS